MKTLSKVLSMLIVVVMCLSLFGASAYATVDVPDVYAGSIGADNGNQAPDIIDVPDMSSGEEPGIFDGEGEIPTTDPGTVPDTETVPDTVTVPEEEDKDEISPYTSGDAVWQVGQDRYYNTLQEAVTAAGTNGRITLIGMTALTSECKINKNVTIDFGESMLEMGPSGKITITGGTVTFTGKGDATNSNVAHSDVLANVTGGTLVINGGSYGEPSFGGSGRVIIKNGYFTSEPNENYIDGNSKWNDNDAVEAGAEKIASINGRGYDSIQEAVNAATSGQTIVINTAAVANIEAGTVTVNSKNITFDVNDETVIFESLNINNSNVTIKGYEIRGTVTLENSTLNLNTQKADTIYVRNSSTLNVNGGEVGTVGVNTATVKMSSGTITSLTAKTNSKLNISGGNVDGFVVDNPGAANRTITGGTWVINDATALDYFKNSLGGNLTADETKAPTYTVTGSGSNPGGSTNPGGTTPSGSYSISANSYVKYSGKSVYVTRGTNAPAITDIWYSTRSDKIENGAKLAFTTYGNTSYIDTGDLDALPAGTYYIFAAFYNTGTGTTQASRAGWIRISNSGTNIPDNPSYDGVLQVGTRYNNDWYQGDGVLQFYVSPYPGFNQNSTNMRVLIDGREIGNLDYYDYLNGYFYIGTAKLESLASGTHWLTVENIEDGATGSCTFYIGPTLKARDTNKHVTGSSRNLKFVCSEPISRVWVGDRELDNYDSYDYYSISRDGKTLTLTARFLNNRTAGSTYNLTVETNTGERVSTTFQILTTAQASSSPKTGDNSNLALWVSALVMSGAAAAVILPKMKKEETEG